jgi:hypothetical protein
MSDSNTLAQDDISGFDVPVRDAVLMGAQQPPRDG